MVASAVPEQQVKRESLHAAVWSQQAHTPPRFADIEALMLRMPYA
jgi:hypothetical protein